MTSTQTQQEARDRTALRRFEFLATILLALATVATAWSSYQATRWNGEASKAAVRANAQRIESAKAADRGNALAEIDVITFTQWVDAYATGEDELREFYEERFRKSSSLRSQPESPPTPLPMRTPRSHRSRWRSTSAPTSSRRGTRSPG